jgi:Putative zinc-finger
MSGLGDVSEHPGDLLSAYLDDELSAGEARRVEAHLVSCGACSAELGDLGAARRLLRDLPAVPAPPGFTRGIVERRRRSTRRGAGLALAAAGVALVLGLALAEPGDDQPSGSHTMSLAGDATRFGTTLTPHTLLGPDDQPGGPSASASASGSTVSTTSTTAGSTTTAENGAGPEDSSSSDPVSLGDRIDDVAANLLELIGG